MTDLKDDLEGLEDMGTSTSSTGSESTREREPEDKGFAVVDKRGMDKEERKTPLSDVSFKQVHKQQQDKFRLRCPGCKKKELSVNFLSSSKLGDVLVCIHCGNAFIPIERVREIWSSVQKRLMQKNNPG